MMDGKTKRRAKSELRDAAVAGIEAYVKSTAGRSLCGNNVILTRIGDRQIQVRCGTTGDSARDYFMVTVSEGMS